MTGNPTCGARKRNGESCGAPPVKGANDLGIEHKGWERWMAEANPAREATQRRIA